jgi:hypothetical protein
MITLRRGGKKIKGAEVYPKLELDLVGDHAQQDVRTHAV